MKSCFNETGCRYVPERGCFSGTTRSRTMWLQVHGLRDALAIRLLTDWIQLPRLRLELQSSRPEYRVSRASSREQSRRRPEVLQKSDRAAPVECQRLRWQRAYGGLVVWVRTRDEQYEQRAVAILKSNKADDVHVHSIEAIGCNCEQISCGLGQLHLLGLRHRPINKKNALSCATPRIIMCFSI